MTEVSPELIAEAAGQMALMVDLLGELMLVLPSAFVLAVAGLGIQFGHLAGGAVRL